VIKTQSLQLKDWPFSIADAFYKIGGMMMNNQFIYDGYRDYGVSYDYPSNPSFYYYRNPQEHASYLNAYQLPHLESPGVLLRDDETPPSYPPYPPGNGGGEGTYPPYPPENGGGEGAYPPYPPYPPENGGGEGTYPPYPPYPPENGGGEGTYPPYPPYPPADGGGEGATPPTTPPPPPTTTPTIQLNDQVRVNQGVQTWATGQGMPSWVHGRTYPVIEIRTRNGVRELLLGNGINSWIRQTDVTRVSGAPTTTPNIQLNERVRVNQGVRTWATGEGMPSWVHGRTYPVIEIRTRNGVRELLLGNGINSWIRQTDVTRVSGTTTTPTPPTTIQLNDRVRVNQGVRTWATGEGMPSWVHGRIYPVIEIRTRNGVRELLLGNGINSWIRQTDVTRVSGTTTTPTPTPPTTIQLNDRVRVNQGVQTWATGQGMPSWVHGRIYPVIEIRTRNGVRELLLGNGINSWIRQTDVTRVSGTTTTPSPTIQLNDRVRVNQGVQTWATGQGMPSWVHGRTYPVIEIRTRNGVRELLLGNGINSWIRQTDVTRV